MVLEEVGNHVWLLISHKMPAPFHDLRSHATAAKRSGELFGGWPGLPRAIIAFEEEDRHLQFVSVSPHECLVLAIRSVQAKPRSQLFSSAIRARIVTHDRLGQ